MNPLRALTHGRALWLTVLLAVFLAVPLILDNGYFMHIAVMALIFVILAVSLDIVLGLAGLLSLGHTAFYAVGAYVAALMAIHWGTSFWINIFVAAAVAGVLAYLLGLVVLNVRGHRFVITTIAFAELGRLVAYNWTEVTGGQIGLPGIPQPTLNIPGLPDFIFNTQSSFYYLAGAIALAAILLAKWISRSPLGWSMEALRENERLAEALGINTRVIAITAFVTGACLAGVAGTMYAHFITFVSPDLFYFGVMTTVLLMVVLGGKGTVIGPVVGAIIFTVIPEGLRIASEYRLIVFGTLLIILVMGFPGGLAQLATLISRRMTRHDVGR
jgi:branched-chain amino acid transport system permease protein